MRPKVAVTIAEYIAEWANIETMMGIFVALLLDTDAKAMLAMYSALNNRTAQLRMIEAAAESKLTPDHNDIMGALMHSFVRPAMKQRDKLAHWCWGYSTELPEALLLMEPNEKMALHMGAVNPPKPVELDRTKIFVVTENDAIRMLDNLRITVDRFSIFMGTVWQSSTVQQRKALLQKLSRDPDIQKEAARRRESRNKGQAFSSSEPSNE